jgi:alpha-amylase/alpha-mannosidase (GH57 family)
LIQIHNHYEKDGSIVSIVLDGENAWEHYADGGEGFLRAAYQTLSQSHVLTPITFSEYLNTQPHKETLPSIHSGSWIHHDFDIWIGSEEENTAWEYLGKTRDFIKELKDVPKEKLDKILNQIYIAEGSDWFWWYGEDFSTENDEEFDQLFRLHLAACYELANHEVPEFLHQPVLDSKSMASAQKPIGFIEPVIDGKTTHFFEWYEAGLYQVSADAAMHRSEKYIQKVFFGFDLKNLYFRIDPYKIKNVQNIEKIQMSIYLMADVNYKITVLRSLKEGKDKKFTIFTSADETNYQEFKKYSSAAFEDTLELAIPFKDLKLKGGEEVRFRITISSGDIVLEMHPKFGYLNFTVPTKDFESEMWSV